MKNRIAVIWISITLLFGFMVFVCDLPESVKGDTIWVDDDFSTENSTHKKTIQAAIDGAGIGDTVFVFNGTYKENIFINRSINLVGENPFGTVIDAGRYENVIQIRSDWVNITGFRIEDSGSQKAGIRLINADYCRIENNQFFGSTYGIYLSSSDNNHILGNTIGDFNGYGIYLSHSVNNEISTNVIMKSTSTGIYFYNSDYNRAKGNIISEAVGSGIRDYRSDGNEIIGNILDDNFRGATIQNDGELVMIDNTIINNRRGILLSGNGNCNISHNIIEGNEDGIRMGYESDGNIFIFYNNISQNDRGIYFAGSPDFTSIFDNNIMYNTHGISFNVPFENTEIISNTIAHNDYSIYTIIFLTEDIYADNVYLNNTNHYKVDSDEDGVPDDLDFDPFDPNVRFDTDGDGHPDREDVFPSNPREWQDTDGDGIGDNSDPDTNGNGIADDWEFPIALMILIIPMVTLISLFKLMGKKKDKKEEESEIEWE
jgi:parallel beta-helix repeat protein